MDAAYTEFQRLALQIGVPLSSDQVSQLKQAIVWLVHREVTFPNGEKHTVLVQKVYLAPTTPCFLRPKVP